MSPFSGFFHAPKPGDAWRHVADVPARDLEVRGDTLGGGHRLWPGHSVAQGTLDWIPDDAPLQDDGLVLPVVRIAGASGFLGVESACVVGVRAGRVVHEQAGVLYFDASEHEVAFTLERGDRRWLVCAVSDALAAWRAEPVAFPTEGTPAVVAAVDLPIAAWSEGAEPWLVAEILEYDTDEDRLSRVVAAGLLCRLWDPRFSGVNVAREVRRVLRASSSEWLDAVVADALERVDDLFDLAAADSPALQVDWLEALTVRDDLQSVAWVLALVDRGVVLYDALEQVDKALSMHATEIDAAIDAGGRRNVARWSAVAWSEPGSWWAIAMADER